MSSPADGGAGRLGTGAAMRPGSSLRPGSSMRHGSVRPGSRLQQPGMGESLQQRVEVNAKAPVAMEGMRASSRSGTASGAGPGRQVGDRSYYIGIVRQKIAELTAEIDRLNEQQEQIGKNSGVLVQLQQRTKELESEIATLKGNLADVNLAVERSTTQDAHSVREEATKLQQQNTENRQKLDDLFLKVKQAEVKTKESQAQLDAETQQLEQRLMSENQDYGVYKSTKDEAYRIADTVLERQHQIRSLTAKQKLLVANLSKDTDKKKAIEILRAILNKKQKKAEYTKQCALSVDDEKKQLIQQVKTTRSDIEVLERQLGESRDALQESRVRARSLDEELKSFSGDNVRALQELREKDGEMQEFIDTYPEKEAEELKKIAALQRSITNLLERLSQGLEAKRQMPQDGSAGALNALSAEVDAKRSQVENDEATHKRLEAELMDRKAELDKVANLDTKIKAELEAHNNKMEEQRQEIAKFSNVDGLRTQVENVRAGLAAQRKFYTKLRNTSSQQLNQFNAEVEALKKQLSSDEKHAALSVQEQKLRVLLQSTFSLEDFVRLREKDTQFLGTRAECLRLVDECNNYLRDPLRFQRV